MDLTDYLRCRLCARLRNHNEQFINITENDHMLLRINSLLPVVVRRNDPLPKEICKACNENLTSFADFYVQTEQAAKFLSSRVTILIEDTDAPVSVQIIEDDDEPIIKSIDSPDNRPILESAFNIKIGSSFIVRKLGLNTTLYSCKNCMRTFVTEESASAHHCTTSPQKDYGSPTERTHHILNNNNVSQKLEPASQISLKRAVNNINEDKEVPHKVGTVDESQNRKTIPGSKKKKMKKSQGSDSDKYRCVYCCKRFNYSAELTLHRRIHCIYRDLALEQCDSEVKPAVVSIPGSKHVYTCGFCQQNFTRKATFTAHEQCHINRSMKDASSDED